MKSPQTSGQGEDNNRKIFVRQKMQMGSLGMLGNRGAFIENLTKGSNNFFFFYFLPNVFLGTLLYRNKLPPGPKTVEKFPVHPEILRIEIQSVSYFS